MIKSLRSILILLFIVHYSLFIANAQDGKAIFERECVACHNIGGGRKVGPDLQGVTKKRDINWLSKFINNSTEFIASGDPDAKKIFQEYNNIPMPAHEFSKAEIIALVNYIDNPNLNLNPNPNLNNRTPLFTPDPEKGKDLFTGKVHLKNNGPSCIFCHSIRYESIFSGGTFAKDLSTSYAEEIVDSMVATLPAMKCSFKNHEVTFTEKSHLEAFLKKVKDEHIYSHPNLSDSFLLLTGTFLSLIFFLVYKLGWKLFHVNIVRENIIKKIKLLTTKD